LFRGSFVDAPLFHLARPQCCSNGARDVEKRPYERNEIEEKRNGAERSVSRPLLVDELVRLLFVKLFELEVSGMESRSGLEAF